MSFTRRCLLDKAPLMKSSLAALILSVVLPSHAAEITIQRQIATTNCIMGYLLVDGKATCHTLELPYRDNKSEISSIPAGHYKGFVRTDGARGWRIELKNVPQRTNVQIHVGNYTRDTTGCTLVGLKASVDDCTVKQSAEAVNKVRTALTPLLDKEISVTYSSPPPTSKQ